MKTKRKEIVIKSVEFKDTYIENQKCFYVYEIETNERLNLNTIDSVITQSTKVPESLTEWMMINGIGQGEVVKFLNNNYKKTIT
jgi:hypothetical protein